MLRGMMHTDTSPTSALLADVEAFLSVTGMGESYFGKRAVNNSELVKRLRAGRPILATTEANVRAFMASHQSSPSPKTAGGA